MKCAIAIVMLLLTHNPAVKPDRQGTKANGASNAETMPTVITVNNDKRAELRPEHVEEAPKWYATIEWANWFLVGVGGLTAFAVWQQTKETTKATQAMRETTDLQKAGMRQWVDVESIAADMQNRPGMDGTEIYLRFEAVNNTPYLLTITRIVTKISFHANRWETFTVEPNAVLLCSRERNPSPYPFYAPWKDDAEGAARFLRGEVILTINGEVTFTDAMNNVEVQYFGGLYRTGPPNIFEYMRPVGLVPDHRTEEHA